MLKDSFSGTLSVLDLSLPLNIHILLSILFAKAEVTKKQRKYFVDADVELLSRYLSSNFVSDLGKYSADQIVAKYGTHVLTNITVVGSYIAYYKSAIIRRKYRCRENNSKSAGRRSEHVLKLGLVFSYGTWSTTTIT